MGGLFLLLLIPGVAIILVILLFTSMKLKSSEGGEDTMKSIYIYLVLFATLMMVIGGSIGVFMTLADIVSPAPYYQSFEEYSQLKFQLEGEDPGELSEEDLRISYNAMIEREKEQSQQRSINTLIKSLGWVIIPLPVFLYFQRRLNRKEQ